MSAARTLLILLLSVQLSGCFAGIGRLTQEGDPDPVLRFEDGIHLQVPVQVLLAGFPQETVDGLARELSPTVVPQDAVLLGPETEWAPWNITAAYNVRSVPAEMDRELAAVLEDARTEGGMEEATYDANAVERWLLGSLPAYGFPLNPSTPTFFLLHLGKFHGGEVGRHAYNYSFEYGWLHPVRAFGEMGPLLVMDVSARTDPWVMYEDHPPWESGREGKPYDKPIPASGSDVVAALEEAVLDATHLRLLQGPIFPVSTKPCHAVTLILGIRTAALTEKAPAFFPHSDSLMNVPRVQEAFGALVGTDRIHVDLDVIRLPQDDPELDSMSRLADQDPGAFWDWLFENWERYWVKHDGCEGYISLLVYGDAGDPSTGGLAMPPREGKRASYSRIGEADRMARSYSGPGGEVLVFRDESLESYQDLLRLFIHETGHLLGLAHPHDVDDGVDVNFSFSSVRSVVSYQTGYRALDFSALDRNNFLRNRAGFAVQEALSLGLGEAPEMQAALEYLQRFEWEKAGDVLLPLVS